MHYRYSVRDNKIAICCYLWLSRDKPVIRRNILGDPTPDSWSLCKGYRALFFEQESVGRRVIVRSHLLYFKKRLKKSRVEKVTSYEECSPRRRPTVCTWNSERRRGGHARHFECWLLSHILKERRLHKEKAPTSIRWAKWAQASRNLRDWHANSLTIRDILWILLGDCHSASPCHSHDKNPRGFKLTYTTIQTCSMKDLSPFSSDSQRLRQSVTVFDFNIKLSGKPSAPGAIYNMWRLCVLWDSGETYEYVRIFHSFNYASSVEKVIHFRLNSFPNQ